MRLHLQDDYLQRLSATIEGGAHDAVLGVGRRVRRHWIEATGFAAVLAVSVAVRVVHLGTTPRILAGDELENLRTAIRVNTGTGPGVFGFDWGRSASTQSLSPGPGRSASSVAPSPTSACPGDHQPVDDHPILRRRTRHDTRGCRARGDDAAGDGPPVPQLLAHGLGQHLRGTLRHWRLLDDNASAQDPGPRRVRMVGRLRALCDGRAVRILSGPLIFISVTLIAIIAVAAGEVPWPDPGVAHRSGDEHQEGGPEQRGSSPFQPGALRRSPGFPSLGNVMVGVGCVPA